MAYDVYDESDNFYIHPKPKDPELIHHVKKAHRPITGESVYDWSRKAPGEQANGVIEKVSLFNDRVHIRYWENYPSERRDYVVLSLDDLGPWTDGLGGYWHVHYGDKPIEIVKNGWVQLR